jgi:hypothetical protein
MYYRFGKAFYFLSVLLFIFFLLYFYSALTEQVSYSVDDQGNLGSQVDKNTFFYLMAGAFILLNFGVLVPPKMLETKSHKGLHRIFPIGDSYRDYFLAWFYFFGGLINLSLSMMVFYIHAINNQESIAASMFNFFFYLFPSLLVLWVIGFFVLLVGKFKQIQANV